MALSRLLEAYLRPDDAALTPDVEADLLALSRSADLDVRALALASLHYARGDSPEVRRELARALESAGEERADEALRARWVLALGYLGDRARDRSDFVVASAAYRKALQLRPDDARVLQALGQMHSRAGSYAEAVASYRRSLDVDAEQPLTWVNLGIALAASGDAAGARGAYEEALRLNPHESLAHFNLGNLHRRADRLPDAAAAYARAVAASPGLGQAHFELARTYILLGRPADALPHARRAVELLPDDASSRAMVTDLERVVGG
jgi:tetratricopeptide (TPR) repeat protein